VRDGREIAPLRSANPGFAVADKKLGDARRDRRPVRAVDDRLVVDALTVQPRSTARAFQ
jgi:hypothetical protein